MQSPAKTFARPVLELSREQLQNRKQVPELPSIFANMLNHPHGHLVEMVPVQEISELVAVLKQQEKRVARYEFETMTQLRATISTS